MYEKERKMGQKNMEDMEIMETTDQTVPVMALHLMNNRKTYGYTTWGCMWEKGAVQKDSLFTVYAQDGVQDCIKNAENNAVPSQARITAYWPDGSVKWTAHTADSSKIGEKLFVTAGKKSACASKRLCQRVERIFFVR